VPTAKASFPLRISAELKKALERLAEADGRSLNSYLTRVLAEHITRAPKPKKG
jgi:hypothetical protein